MKVVLTSCYGRPYQIKTKTKQDFTVLLEDLIKLSATAREQAEAKSRFKRLQGRVAAAYSSDTSQRSFGLMIIGVSARRFLS